MSNLLKVFLLITSLIIFTGCNQVNLSTNSSNEAKQQNTLESKVKYIVDQLFESQNIDKKKSITLTKFRGLGEFQNDQNIGQELSFKILNELEKRGLKVIDVRGIDRVKVDQNGQITETIKGQSIHKNTIGSSYIMVSTYSKFSEGVLLNIRVVDHLNGQVISRARVILENGMCKSCTGLTNITQVASNVKQNETKIKEKVIKRTIKLQSRCDDEKKCEKNICNKNEKNCIANSIKKRVQKPLNKEEDTQKNKNTNKECGYSNYE